MPSQPPPPPWSTGGSPRILAPFQPAPDSTGRSPRTAAPLVPGPGTTVGSPQTPAPFQPAPGSTGGIPRTPLSVPLVSKKSTVLVDWYLERVEGEEGKIRVAGTTYTPKMRNGASSSRGNKKVPGRVFRSSAIAKRCDFWTIESDDGFSIYLDCLLNIHKTRENGFSEEVCECFEFGFPIPWERLVNPKMVLDNEHAGSPSETAASAPSHSVKYHIDKFLSDNFANSFRYEFTENDLYSSVPPKIMSVVNESYRSTEGCGQAEEDADIQQESMHTCSSEHGMVTLPIDCTSSQLGESGILKSGKDSVSLGTTDALEIPTEGMTPKFGAIRGSKDSTGKRLRSGKVLGMPSGEPMKRGHKQKKIQQEASSKQMVNQGATSTADPTYHENDFSAAEVFVEEQLESHDSCRKGRGRPAKGKGKGKGKRGSPDLSSGTGCETCVPFVSQLE